MKSFVQSKGEVRPYYFAKHGEGNHMQVPVLSCVNEDWLVVTLKKSTMLLRLELMKRKTREHFSLLKKVPWRNELFCTTVRYDVNIRTLCRYFTWKRNSVAKPNRSMNFDQEVSPKLQMFLWSSKDCYWTCTLMASFVNLEWSYMRLLHHICWRWTKS